MTNLDGLGPVLTRAEAAALHDRPEGVAWFAIPAPDGAGVIARAHAEARDSGRLLLSHLAGSDLAELQAMTPQGFFQQVIPDALIVDSDVTLLGLLL